MKKTILILIAFIVFLTSCHKDNEDNNGNLLGAWQVERCTTSIYDANGNLQSTYDEGLGFTYIDYNDEGWTDYYIFKVSSGDKWVFIDDTTVHIKDKMFTYHNIYIDDMRYIRLDAPNLKYEITTLSESTLELKYLEIYEGNNPVKEEITFKKL